jgi:GAF domain-containing protein
VEVNGGQQGAVGLLQIDAVRTAAITTAVQARTAAQAEARESRRADAHVRAGEALAGVFQKDTDLDTALRAMTARACVALVAERCSFLHRLARSEVLLYEFEVASAGPMAPARGQGIADLRGSIPQPSVETTASRFECSASCNPVTFLRSHGWPTAAHVFLHRIGDAEPLGILSAYRAEGRPFTPEDILLLDAIADRVTLALIRKLR